MDHDEGFQLVKPKKVARRCKHGLAQDPRPTGTSPLDCTDTCTPEKALSKLAVCQKELMNSSYTYGVLQTFIKAGIIQNHPDDVFAQAEILDGSGAQSSSKFAASSFQELVCYGVGNFSTSYIARYQLALCLHLGKLLHIDSACMYFFDPLFTESEKQTLGLLGASVLTKNEEGKRKVEKTTLFYMPHCGKALYNNLLWANWSMDRLQNLVIIGNSFEHITLSTPDRILQIEAEYIKRCQPIIIEFPIPNKFEHSDIFNDTSVHVPITEKVSVIGSEFWQNAQEPQYDDASDIIPATTASS